MKKDIRELIREKRIFLDGGTGTVLQSMGLSVGVAPESWNLTNPEKVASREELMEKVWNYEYYGDMRTVDVTVRRLREKIETNPAEPEHIITRRGAGYLFKK